MNRSRILFFLLSLAVMLPVISGTLSRAATDQPADDDALSKHLSVFSEVMSLAMTTKEPFLSARGPEPGEMLDRVTLICVAWLLSLSSRAS